MSTRETTSTPANASRTAELCDKHEGYPARGIQADGSSHPRVPLSWDGAVPVPVGWTSYKGAVNGSVFGAAKGSTWLSVNTAAPNLTPAERTELITLLTPARAFDSNFGPEFW